MPSDPQPLSGRDADPPLQLGPLGDRLRTRQALLWLNPGLGKAGPTLASVASDEGLDLPDIQKAEALFRRWAPALARLFPEFAASGGMIESPLIEPGRLDRALGCRPEGRLLIKCDHALPVAGSVKARGGVFEVLAHAEALADRHGLPWGGDPARLLEPEARTLFQGRAVSVGSTGNLGLAIGIMASALGFRAVVHMSRDAKAWKKERLRNRGVEVVEHGGDYAAAVAAGRAEAAREGTNHFVDDEDSLALFLGYSVAAFRLRSQLEERDIPVDPSHPLLVYLPCGVGGAPGGITFGLKHVFGDSVHCFFAEPTASPAMLLRLAAGRPASVYELGLDCVTDADGLAVPRASERVARMVGGLVSGVYTMTDEELYAALANLEEEAGQEIEPSSAAAFLGPRRLLSGAMRRHLEGHLGIPALARATHLFWTTGGSLVPRAEFEAFCRRGRGLPTRG